MVTSLSPLPLSFSFTLIPQAERHSDKVVTVRAKSRRARKLALAIDHTSKIGRPVISRPIQAGAAWSDAGNADRQTAVNRDFSEKSPHGAGLGNRSVRERTEVVLRIRKV